MKAADSRESRAAKLRTRLRWAITITNFIGMPALAIYIAAILGASVSHFTDDLYMDPAFLVLNFVILVLISATFVIIHYFHVIKAMAPVEAFLDSPAPNEDGRKRQASEALAASEYMPYKTMAWSAFYYAVGTPVAILSIQFCYSFSLRQVLALWIGITVTGLLISVFQFYTARRALQDFEKSVLGYFPELLLENNSAKSRSWTELGLQAKFMGAMVLLAVVTVVLTTVAAFNSSHRGLQTIAANQGLERMQDRAGEVESMVASGAGPQELASYLYSMGFEKGRRIILVDRQMNTLLPGALSPEEESILKILAGEGALVESRKPSVHKLDTRPGLKGLPKGSAPYSVVAGWTEFAAAHVQLSNSHLLFLAPSADLRYAISGMYWLVGAVMFVALLPLALIFGWLASRDIRDPLVTLMDSMKAMSTGDLTKHVQVTARDEIGILARSLARAIFGLRRLIGRIELAAAALDQSASTISSLSGEVISESKTQVDAVDQTSVSMEQMKQSAGSIADSIQTMASSTEQSSASILEVQTSTEEVAASVDDLSSSVIQTTASIQQMNASVKEVANNVQHLTKRSEEAMAALMEMGKMISQVTESAESTAKISGKVTSDAEHGAEAVEQTIKGIGKIRGTSEAVAEVITSLGDRASRVGNILNVIEDVTEETNLLALNAAIIAAQAGEHGRGFAVVADEIKDLAERTASSTREIAEVLSGVQEDASQAVIRVREDMDSILEGVRLAEDAGKALHKIQESVRNAMEQTKSIADAASVQAQKSEQVTDFMNGVNSLIAQIAVATQEQTKSGDQITAAAARMEDIAKQVKRATQEQIHGSRQITQAIEHIAEIAQYINSSQTEQTRGTDLVVKAVARIKEVADNNQQRADQMHSNVENLKELSDELKGLLQEFTL